MLSAKVCAAGLNPPLLAGNIISNGMSLLVIVTLTYIFPDKIPFQWEAFKEKITTADATVRHPHGSCQCSACFLLFFFSVTLRCLYVGAYLFVLHALLIFASFPQKAC